MGLAYYLADMLDYMRGLLVFLFFLSLVAGSTNAFFMYKIKQLTDEEIDKYDKNIAKHARNSVICILIIAFMPSEKSAKIMLGIDKPCQVIEGVEEL